MNLLFEEHKSQLWDTFRHQKTSGWSTLRLFCDCSNLFCSNSNLDNVAQPAEFAKFAIPGHALGQVDASAGPGEGVGRSSGSPEFEL